MVILEAERAVTYLSYHASQATLCRFCCSPLAFSVSSQVGHRFTSERQTMLIQSAGSRRQDSYDRTGKVATSALLLAAPTRASLTLANICHLFGLLSYKK
jgi:hypothetical protein